MHCRKPVVAVSKIDHIWWFMAVLGIVLIVLLVFWLLWRRPWELWSITDNVDGGDLRAAKKAAKSSRAPILKKLPYTEGNYRWTLLYNHAREGQIDPSVMKRMRRMDLEYLAGMDFPHPDLVEPRYKSEPQKVAEERHAQITKLQGNVSRAKAELSRRNLWMTTLTAAVAVLFAGILGALLAAS